MKERIIREDKSRPLEFTSSNVLEGAPFGIDISALPVEGGISLAEQERISDEIAVANEEAAKRQAEGIARIEAAKKEKEARLAVESQLKAERSKGEDVAGVYSKAAAYATLGADVFTTMFGGDNPGEVSELVRQELLDSFQLLMLNDVNFRNRDSDAENFVMSSHVPLPGLNLADEDSSWLSFPHVVAGYNKLASQCGFRDVSVEVDMYTGRTAEWFNRSVPPLKISANNKIITDWDPEDYEKNLDPNTLLEGVLFNPELHSDNTKLSAQQVYLKSVARMDAEFNKQFVTCGARPADMFFLDAMSIYNSTLENPIVDPEGLPRMDEENFVRLAQYDRSAHGGNKRRRGADVHIKDGVLTFDSSVKEYGGSHVHTVIRNSVDAIREAYPV